MPSERAKNPKPRAYQQHGQHTIRRALASVDDMARWLSDQGDDGAAARALRDQLIAEQGGEAHVSRKELVTIDTTLSLVVLASSIGRFIGTMPSPVNKVKRTVFPVVKDYITVQKALRESFLDLNELRLKRPEKAPLSLDAYVQQRYPKAPMTSTEPVNGTSEPSSEAET
jgi:hypothetical protein